MLQAPFPWFGGKSRVADIVWERFGKVRNYVEPFFGSGAVLLRRPHEPFIETINDLDGFIANFWRAVAHDPVKVAEWSDWPVNENDLHARHAWLIPRRAELTARLVEDPDYYDAKIAGWWVWGISAWVGHGWCSSKSKQIPHLSSAGQGINRTTVNVPEWFATLSVRLRRVRVCCGDWSRVVTPAVITASKLNLRPCGVFLDPPYDATRNSSLYAVDSTTVHAAVNAWCVANGDDPGLRIALCGYEGSFDPPGGWVEMPWKASGGYGLQGNKQGRANANRERIWFSPHCLTTKQITDIIAELDTD